MRAVNRNVSLTAVVWLLALAVSQLGAQAPASAPRTVPPAPAPATRTAAAALAVPDRAMLDKYCVGCHNERAKIGNFALDGLDLTHADRNAAEWEKVVLKLRGGLMPPAGRPRPDDATRLAFVSSLERTLDAAAASHPNAGRTETFHRLNRVEYRNAVRDVLALDIDVAALLPSDSASYGFDNMAGALKMSESLMERYLSAARKISRAALGEAGGVVAQTYNVSPALLQNEHVEGLPFGTRGGSLIKHYFPEDAEYSFRFDLAGVATGADVDVLLDGDRLQLLSVKSGRRAVDIDGNEAGEKLEFRAPIAAGPHDVGVAFLYTPALLAEANRKPFMNPTVSNPGIPYLRGVTITGPFNGKGASNTPSRKRIFICDQGTATTPAAETACAKRIFGALARRAYRRPVDDEDLSVLMTAYRDARTSGDFEAGIERGVQQLLVGPEFLFRVEAEPGTPTIKPASNYRISDLDLASRLSFFLWSSVPDEALLVDAVQNRLHLPAVLDAQVRRMLKDPRSSALTSNFVGQWLQLRNLEAATPSEVLFPDFNGSLRQDFRTETEMFFDSIVREDKSALDLLTANYTFLNDRLARHYGVPGISGTHFRRVTLTDQRRFGLLGQGSILTITSQPVRTSPVFRGKWILDNILGTPPPPPPPNVPALPEKSGVYAGKMPSMRERMAEHRANPACASCHAMIDPLGFGLEQFDPVGRTRLVDEMFKPIDASGTTPDGTRFDGVAGLRAALVRQPENFVQTLTIKLMTYALGRGVEYYDMPAVRKIVHDAAPSHYSVPAIISGITRSLPFENRRTAPTTLAAN
jgi:mono/diheme cytochrome c family protein